MYSRKPYGTNHLTTERFTTRNKNRNGWCRSRITRSEENIERNDIKKTVLLIAENSNNKNTIMDVVRRTFRRVKYEPIIYLRIPHTQSRVSVFSRAPVGRIAENAKAITDYFGCYKMFENRNEFRFRFPSG